MAEIRWIQCALPALLCCAAAAQSWQPQASGATASLRGISAVSARVAWASGTGGAYLLTTDGGTTWRAAQVPGAETLDFRAVHALDERTAWLMSIGTGTLSRVYKTTDGGAHWRLQFTNPDAKGFFDCLAFRDARHGILVGDAVDGALAVFTTADGGDHWTRMRMPAALEGEGAFAASNSALIVRGSDEAWIGTSAARVYHLQGSRVTVSPTPARKGPGSAGIFSLAFADERRGMAVGGDYTRPDDAAHNIAITADGGLFWTAPPSGPAGFRSAVVYLPGHNAWLATGTSGSDISFDDGRNWKTFDTGNYNALGFSGDEGWAVGPNGRIAKWRAVAMGYPQEKPMPQHATGTFEVKLTPQSQGSPLGRMSIDKQFHGALEGASKGEMLTAATSVKESAGYVALELVSGTLAGRSGTFILQHNATMDRGTPHLSIAVVPDSGTGQLTGLTGKMNIQITGGKHSYDFEYTLPPQ